MFLGIKVTVLGLLWDVNALKFLKPYLLVSIMLTFWCVLNDLLIAELLVFCYCNVIIVQSYENFYYASRAGISITSC